jgi:hypothetical protein
MRVKRNDGKLSFGDVVKKGAVIKNPEITKKTSTPTKPPPKPGTPARKKMTGATAIARSRSMSGAIGSRLMACALKLLSYFCTNVPPPRKT